MKRSVSRVLCIFAIGGLFSMPQAFAELGLKQIAASQGAVAVGSAVLAAVKAIYAQTTDPAEVQRQLVAVLNEAAATADEGAMRYTMVAVMMAGGAENIGQAEMAIGQSNLSAEYRSLVTEVVSETKTMMMPYVGVGGGDGGPTLLMLGDASSDGDLSATPN